jgi:DNA mismatch endonuclease, patch repair protein
MSGIRSKNTRHEVEIRKGLHALGFRYRLHDNRLPGKPDIIFPQYRAVVFINGCFWHAHDCDLFRLPSTNVEFWRRKLLRNSGKDRENNAALRGSSWRVMTIWECSFRGSGRQREKEIARIIVKTVKWLRSKRMTAEIKS